MGVIIVLAILGPILLWSGIHLINKSKRVRQWPNIEATLTKKEAKLTDKPGGSLSARHEPDILYYFEYKGQKHESNSYSHVTALTDEKTALKKAQSLPDKMVAFVNPEKPEESYLVAPSMILAYIITGIGLLFVLILLALIIAKM